MWDFAHNQQQGLAEDPFSSSTTEPTNRLVFSIGSCQGGPNLTWDNVDAALEGLYYAMPYDGQNQAFLFTLLDFETRQEIGAGSLSTVNPGLSGEPTLGAGVFELQTNGTISSFRS